MSFKLKIIIGALIVTAASCLTMIANYPKMYSPYSLSVVFPALFISSREMGEIVFHLLSSMPILVLYLIFSIAFIKPTYKISKLTLIIAIVLALLSVAFNIYSYKYGIKYQGMLHTVVMYFYNLVFLSFAFSCIFF